jgi:hypothetical protein
VKAQLLHQEAAILLMPESFDGTVEGGKLHVASRVTDMWKLIVLNAQRRWQG